MSWVQTLALILISYVNLGKPIELSEPQFPSFVKWGNAVVAVKIDCVHVKPASAWHLTNNKYVVVVIIIIS